MGNVNFGGICGITRWRMKKMRGGVEELCNERRDIGILGR
jgi:hypothetical protein